MKYSLLLFALLYAVVVSQMGGWKKGSFAENDMGIDRAYKKAIEEYSKENPNADIDSTQRLTIYRQVVNGINYRMTFIDLKSQLNVIQEYVINTPPYGSPKRGTFQLYAQATHTPSEQNLDLNDSKVSKIQKELYKFDKQDMYDINKVEVIETELDIFYIVYTKYKNKDRVYVVSQTNGNEYNFETLARLK